MMITRQDPTHATGAVVVNSTLTLAATAIEKVGVAMVRYGLVIVLLWIGGMKFTAYEAGGIKGFVDNSPLMSFLYRILSVRDFSTALGVVEIVIALMIAARPVVPRLSALGSIAAIGMVLTTLTFMITTPGVFEPTAGGFPAISSTGQFLVKDFVLLGAAVLTLGETLRKTQTLSAKGPAGDV
jgi:uncharacterized membrane protein YkgB